MGYMTYDELSPEQKLQVKQNYLLKLADEGKFVEVVYGEGEERDPSMGELADADKLVPDDVIKHNCDGIAFVPEDFGPVKNPTWEQLEEWASKNLTISKYNEEHGTEIHHFDLKEGIMWAKEKVLQFCLKGERGQL